MKRRTAVCALLMAGASRAARNKIAVIAHRGEHQHHPENTVAAIEAAIALGCDYVEIDVRTTSDGHYVLMHNDSVDATTGGKGKVVELSLAAIRQLRAQGERVPTLDEALEAMHGKCAVYFDAKRIPAPAIVAALKQHQMMEGAVVYGSFALMQDLASLGYPQLAMPEAVSVETLHQALSEIRPRIVAFDRSDFRDEIIAVARQAGCGIFADRLGAQDNRAAWEDAIRRGATGIQSDHPAELLEFVRSL